MDPVCGLPALLIWQDMHKTAGMVGKILKRLVQAAAARIITRGNVLTGGMSQTGQKQRQDEETREEAGHAAIIAWRVAQGDGRSPRTGAAPQWSAPGGAVLAHAIAPRPRPWPAGGNPNNKEVSMKVILPALERIFCGRRSDLALSGVLRSEALVSVSIAPDDTCADVRRRLVEDLIRARHPQDWLQDRDAPWSEIYAPLAEAAFPGCADQPADTNAPPPPLGARPWQLAPDPQAYGDHAGWWIVVDATGARELGDGVYETMDEAEAEAERLNEADPRAEWYRHWFAIRSAGNAA